MFYYYTCLTLAVVSALIYLVLPTFSDKTLDIKYGKIARCGMWGFLAFALLIDVFIS
jgi:hypothetical protein